MLLKCYLERGVSKAELSRRFGVNRRTIPQLGQHGPTGPGPLVRREFSARLSSQRPQVWAAALPITFNAARYDRSLSVTTEASRS